MSVFLAISYEDHYVDRGAFILKLRELSDASRSPWYVDRRVNYASTIYETLFLSVTEARRTTVEKFREKATRTGELSVVAIPLDNHFAPVFGRM